MDKNTLKAFALSLAVTPLAAAFFVTRGLDSLENRSVDYRFSARGPVPVSNNVVIVTADDASFKRLGLWPWSRRDHGKLIDRLSAAGAKAIAFDILFLEKDEKDPASDRSLGQAAARSGRVIFGMLFHQSASEGGTPVDPDFPIDALHSDSVTVGSVNFTPETDGVCRRVPAWVDSHEEGLEGRPMPSLSLAAYAVAKGISVPQAIEELDIPVYEANAWNEYYLNFLGGYQTFPYYSFADVIEGQVPAEAFKDKIVLVGGTAVGLFDYKAVPNVPTFPGLEIHANAIENFLTRSFLSRVNPLWTLLLILVFGLGIGLISARIPTWAGLISAGVILAYYGACQYAFARHYLILDFVGPAFSVLASYVVVFFYRFRHERKEKRWIRDTFTQYMSPKIVDAITKNPDLLKLGGEDREMTVFFSDLVGFTSIAESMTPRELVAVLNEYLTEMSNVVFQHGGVVDKYIGDAIMAFWNAPIDQPDHAVQACLTALEQQARLKDLQERFAARSLPHIDFRVGINTGHMVVGNMGSQSRFEYTVMGDAVNMASRLEGANKSFHTRIMISEFTYQKAKDAVEVRPLDLLRVKGKNVPIQVYELSTRKGQLSPAQEKGFAHYREGLALYREKKFEKAIAALKETLAALPDDGPSRAYIERCENFIAFPPPPTWDGVYVMKTK